MAKNVRISDALYSLAQLESRLENRSIAQQLEYWAKLGMVSGKAGATTGGATSSSRAAVEATRRLDALDVQMGSRQADYFHFIPRSVARKSKLKFPTTFRKS